MRKYIFNHRNFDKEIGLDSTKEHTIKVNLQYFNTMQQLS